MSEIRIAKWHPIFGKDLMVALEATFGINTDLYYQSEFASDKLIHCDQFVRRVYYPAMIHDGSDKNNHTINFIPWVNETEVKHHRLCLWGRGIPEGTRITFARIGEEKTFKFNDSSKPYMALDFFSKRNGEFVPLYVRLMNGKTNTPVYLVLTANASEESVELIISQLSEADVPSILTQTNN